MSTSCLQSVSDVLRHNRVCFMGITQPNIHLFSSRRSSGVDGGKCSAFTNTSCDGTKDVQSKAEASLGLTPYHEAKSPCNAHRKKMW